MSAVLAALSGPLSQCALFNLFYLFIYFCVCVCVIGCSDLGCRPLGITKSKCVH